MSGYLLIAPTGSGKSWVCENDSFFLDHATDGDSLIDWGFNWNNVDWTVHDRKHFDIVLSYMRETRRCVCWYVGTTAIADALADGRLCAQEIGIVVLPANQHRQYVEMRNKRGHSWDRALEHRSLCESLIRRYELRHFVSFQEATERVQEILNVTQSGRTIHCIEVADRPH